MSTAVSLQLKSSKSVPNTPSTSPRDWSKWKEKATEVCPSKSLRNGDSKKKKAKLFGFPARDVAEEMTLLDAGLLRLIKASELEDGAWMKKDKVCFAVAEET